MRSLENKAASATTRPAVTARRLLQRKCACGGGEAGLSGVCEECRANSLGVRRQGAGHAQHPGAPPAGRGRPLDLPGEASAGHLFSQDFARVRVFSGGEGAATSLGRAVNDQTPPGGAGEEFEKGGAPAPAKAPEPAAETPAGPGTPVVDEVELVSSAGGAVGGYPAKEDMCHASLNTPGPFNDPAFRGSVANVHQVHFHLSQGSPADLRTTRVVKRTAEGRGQKFEKSGNDGPPSHEYQFTKDKLVIADAPGWCNTLKESDFPVTYKGDFALYAFDPLTNKILASISYKVEITKTHYSQRDPVNTVSVTGKMIGGGVPSPVKKEQKPKEQQS